MMIKQHQQMKDKFNMVNGIFSYLEGVPWDTSATSLDLVYFSRSADKYISPLVENIQADTDKLTSDSLNALGASIMAIYGYKWTRLFNALHAEYNVLDNYVMHEEGTHNETTEGDKKKTGTDTIINSGQDTTSHNGTDTHTLSGTDKESTKDDNKLTKTGNDKETDKRTENRNVFGFNTTDTAGVPDSIVTINDEKTIEHNTTDTTASTGERSTNYGRTDTENVNLSDATTYGKSTATNYNTTEDRSGKTDGSHSIDKHGRINGNVPEMIHEEIMLREMNLFNDIVFPDVDNLLCLKVY